MAGKDDWICPVCGHLNRPELVVCDRTPDHDGEED